MECRRVKVDNISKDARGYLTAFFWGGEKLGWELASLTFSATVWKIRGGFWGTLDQRYKVLGGSLLYGFANYEARLRKR